MTTPIVARAGSDAPYCGSDGQPALGIVQVTAGRADATVYVDDRNYVSGNGIWLYAETNGMWTPKFAGVYFGDPRHEDLQRGGGWCFVPCDMLWCMDDTPNANGPDLLVI